VSWNRIILASVTSFLLLTNIAHTKELRVLSEDSLIIQGLLFDEYRAYENSRRVFAKLYDNTGAKEYLFREMTASLLSGKYIANSIKRLKSWDEKHPDTLEVKRLLIPLYLTNQQVGEAKIEAEYLIERSTEAKDLDLASNPYLYSGEFKKALELLDKAYKKTSNEDVLLRMTVVMDEYTNQRKKAIQLLETHRRMNIVNSNQLFFKLLSLYVKENNIDGVLDLYKVLYAQDDQEKYLIKIIEAYVYKRDIDGAISFLEEHNVGDTTLYELYKNKKYFDKALKLTNKLYKKDKDAKWLAEKAILTFENAVDKNDKKMIDKVIAYFDKAISLGVDDSIYLNYYGYTLIDKEINVKKGMKIIADALIQQPDNTYYLDSLAWGYYKENDCTKAYQMMKKVVEQEGLEEPEIAKHWDLIQKCK
jgi:predicted Zn-dependent protease